MYDEVDMTKTIRKERLQVHVWQRFVVHDSWLTVEKGCSAEQ